MCRVLAILIGVLTLTPYTSADEIVFPNGSNSSVPGGLMIIRKGNQTTWTLGGAFLPRSVKIVTNTPEGKVITRFKMPSVFQDPYAPPLPGSAPARFQLEIPDAYGLLFIEGEQVGVKGTSRQLESPALPPDKAYPLRLRAAFAVGNHLLIEDKQIQIRAGEITAVTFDGSRAIAVPLPNRAPRQP